MDRRTDNTCVRLLGRADGQIRKRIDKYVAIEEAGRQALSTVFVVTPLDL